MDGLLICVTAFLASGLTFFSGFGLGSLLLPAFALFFPIPAAVAATAVVHLLNNLFKLVLVGRNADLRVLLRFGGPALAAAFAGGAVLVRLSRLPAWITYDFLGKSRAVTPVDAVVAGLMAVFALMELLPALRRFSLGPGWLPLGGCLSGFFGGVSGHQGAFRSAFLLKLGLDTRRFIATGVVIAAGVDLARLAVYSSRFQALKLNENVPLLSAAVLSAFAGAWAGARLIGKVTMERIRVTVGILLILIAIGLGTGLL